MKKFAFVGVVIAALAFWRKDSLKSDAGKVTEAAKGAKDKVAARLPNRTDAEETDGDEDSDDSAEAETDAAESADETDSDSEDAEASS
jgi:hypothetical protein